MISLSLVTTGQLVLGFGEGGQPIATLHASLNIARARDLLLLFVWARYSFLLMAAGNISIVFCICGRSFLVS